MDFAGSFEPAFSSGKKYILILVHVAIKWPEAVAMTSQRADKVADEMIKLFSRLGLPMIIARLRPGTAGDALRSPTPLTAAARWAPSLR